MTVKDNGQLTSHCECTGPGWCERHCCHKSPHLYRLCKSRADYFQLWEERRGPGQTTTTPMPTNGRSIPKRPREDCQITVAMDVAGLSTHLNLSLELLNLQSEQPWITLFNQEQQNAVHAASNGSNPAWDELRLVCSSGQASRVAAAVVTFSVALSTCQSSYLLLIRPDCYLRRQNLLEEMLLHCRTKSPVVGYELNPRPEVPWIGRIGWTCTLLDVDVMRRIGAGDWLVRRSREQHENGQLPNFDAELHLNELLDQHRIVPYLIGSEDYFGFTRDENIEFVRTVAAGTNNHRHAANQQAANDVHHRARARISQWRSRQGIISKGST